jgi:hypothetical protein
MSGWYCIPNGYDTTKCTDAAKMAKRAMLKLGLDSDPEYMKCLLPELEDRFLNASKTFLQLTYESAGLSFFQGRNLVDLQEEHDVLFWKAQSKYKFCDYNVDKLLSNEHFAMLAFGYPTKG